MSTDYNSVELVGIQISADGQRVWLCIDGACVLRVKGIKEPVRVQDDRDENTTQLRERLESRLHSFLQRFANEHKVQLDRIPQEDPMKEPGTRFELTVEEAEEGRPLASVVVDVEELHY